MQQAEIDLLVMSAQSGNQAAFAKLVSSFNQPLLHFGYRLCANPELVKDAVQETWLNTAKSLHKLNDPSAFRCWLYQNLRWRITDLARKQQLVDHNEITDKLDDVAAQNKQASNVSDELTKAIAQLGDIEQQVLHLFYLDEMKMVEIAAVLSIPVGTVKSRLDRARKQLKTLLED
ncbi:RNA polymerase sigma factor [Catenovulum sp. SX2]|uniref:RNA polymerase sigma factor n=1 Tax=Catenovulum sp. SX2 TaxID=3398614 RepID=UPI003F86F8CB